MIEDVKRVMIQKLDKEIEEDIKRKEIIEHELKELDKRIVDLEREQSRSLIVKPTNFTFFQKWFTMRSAYKLQQSQAKKSRETLLLLNKLKADRNTEYAKVEQELETSGISERIENVSQKEYTIKCAETLYAMGITPEQAVKLLEDSGIQPTLSENDKVIASHPRDYSTKSSLICVHKTKYMPTESMIKTPKTNNFELHKKIELDGKEYDLSFKHSRDTIHMSMNDEVSSHTYRFMG